MDAQRQCDVNRFQRKAPNVGGADRPPRLFPRMYVRRATSSTRPPARLLPSVPTSRPAPMFVPPRRPGPPAPSTSGAPGSRLPPTEGRRPGIGCSERPRGMRGRPQARCRARVGVDNGTTDHPPNLVALADVIPGRHPPGHPGWAKRRLLLSSPPDAPTEPATKKTAAA